MYRPLNHKEIKYFKMLPKIFQGFIGILLIL